MIIVTTAVAAVGLGAVADWNLPAWWALPALAVAAALGESAAIKVHVRRQYVSYGLIDVPVAFCLVVAPGSWIALGVAAGLVASQLRHRPWFKMSFNVACQAASVMLCLPLVHEIDGPLGACVGTMTYVLLTHVFVAVAVSSTSGEHYLRVVLRTSVIVLPQAVGNTSVGVLGGWLVLQDYAVSLLGLVAPLLALWALYLQMTQRVAEARLFEELATGDEKVAGRSVDVSAQVVVTAAARCFGGAEVELLLRHPDGPLRYVGDERGVQSRERVDAFSEPWVLRALARRGIQTGTENGRPFWTAVLGDRELPLACLLVRRGPKSSAFTRSDERLATVLVRQAESWLSVADLTTRHDEAVVRAEAFDAATRVLGDIGEHTAPAVTVLRESVNRLSRLAEALDGPGDVDEIVDELHAVERAVASLLGAIRLTANGHVQPLPANLATRYGRARSGSSRHGPSQQGACGGNDGEWTSTGSLPEDDDLTGRADQPGHSSHTGQPGASGRTVDSATARADRR